MQLIAFVHHFIVLQMQQTWRLPSKIHVLHVSHRQTMKRWHSCHMTCPRLSSCAHVVCHRYQGYPVSPCRCHNCQGSANCCGYICCCWWGAPGLPRRRPRKRSSSKLGPCFFITSSARKHCVPHPQKLGLFFFPHFWMQRYLNVIKGIKK